MILCKDVFSLVNADDFIDYKIASSNGFWKVWSEIEEHHDVELRNKIIGEINNTLNQIKNMDVVQNSPFTFFFLESPLSLNEIHPSHVHLVHDSEILKFVDELNKGNKYIPDLMPHTFALSNQIISAKVPEAYFVLFGDKLLPNLLFDYMFALVSNFNLKENDDAKKKMQKFVYDIANGKNEDEIQDILKTFTSEAENLGWDFEKLDNENEFINKYIENEKRET